MLNLEINAMVLGSNPAVVILILCNYICDFPVKFSSNYVKKDKHWFCLK